MNFVWDTHLWPHYIFASITNLFVEKNENKVDQTMNVSVIIIEYAIILKSIEIIYCWLRKLANCNKILSNKTKVWIKSLMT